MLLLLVKELPDIFALIDPRHEPDDSDSRQLAFDDIPDLLLVGSAAKKLFMRFPAFRQPDHQFLTVLVLSLNYPAYLVPHRFPRLVDRYDACLLFSRLNRR